LIVLATLLFTRARFRLFCGKEPRHCKWTFSVQLCKTEYLESLLQPECSIFASAILGIRLTTNWVSIEKPYRIKNFLDVYESKNRAAVISQRLSRLNRSGSVNQRARPLSAIHESALQRFLNTQK
jgi:hypothetical protein